MLAALAMPWPIFLLATVAALAALYVAAERARTLAVCTITAGRVDVVRGKLPPALLSDIRDIVTRHAIRQGRLTVRTEDRRPTLIAEGFTNDAASQQLRNVVGRFPLARFR